MERGSYRYDCHIHIYICVFVYVCVYLYVCVCLALLRLVSDGNERRICKNPGFEEGGVSRKIRQLSGPRRGGGEANV